MMFAPRMDRIGHPHHSHGYFALSQCVVSSSPVSPTSTNAHGIARFRPTHPPFVRPLATRQIAGRIPRLLAAHTCWNWFAPATPRCGLQCGWSV